jgi:hypothetical protein
VDAVEAPTEVAVRYIVSDLIEPVCVIGALEESRRKLNPDMLGALEP